MMTRYLDDDDARVAAALKRAVRDGAVQYYDSLDRLLAAQGHWTAAFCEEVRQAFAEHLDVPLPPGTACTLVHVRTPALPEGKWHVREPGDVGVTGYTLIMGVAPAPPPRIEDARRRRER